MLKTAAGVTAATAVLYACTQNERRIDQAATPSLSKFASILLPSFGIHTVGVGKRKSLVLDSHKDGESPKEVVVMVHGFPDNPLYFHKVAKKLTAAGYRVVIPCLPGYDSSSVSGGLKDKDAKNVVKYLMAVLNCLDLGKYHLVGHDWGALFVALMANEFPDQIKTLTISAVPHNAPIGVMRFPTQYRYSWYFALMQLPLVPEFWLGRMNGVEWLWKSWSPMFTDLSKPEDAVFWQSILETFRQPGVAKDAINYYRQNLGQGNIVLRLMLPFLMVIGYAIGLLRKKKNQTARLTAGEKKIMVGAKIKPIEVPVLGLSGESDGCMMNKMFEYLHSENGGAEDLFPMGYKFNTIVGAGHFSFVEQPDTITDLLIDWFKQGNLKSKV